MMNKWWDAYIMATQRLILHTEFLKWEGSSLLQIANTTTNGFFYPWFLYSRKATLITRFIIYIMAFVLSDMSHVMIKPVFAICEQQRRRSACASAQPDQRLCYSLLRWYNTYIFYIRNFKPLHSFCGCTGRFEYPGRKPRRQVFSWRGSYMFIVVSVKPIVAVFEMIV